MGHLPQHCMRCGKPMTTKGVCNDCLKPGMNDGRYGDHYDLKSGIKMKFSEWFDTKNLNHMDIASYFYENGCWPSNTELDNIDQSDRHKWSLEIAFILAKKCIEDYQKNRDWLRLLENFRNSLSK